MQALMKFYDVDGSGTISYMEFSRGMRDELTERRLAMTKKAFNMMDKDGSGVVTKADLMGGATPKVPSFSASHPSGHSRSAKMLGIK